MAHDSANHQRLLQSNDQRNLLPCRHPATSLLQCRGRRRLQLWSHRRGHRTRNDPRLRRSGQPIRQGRQPSQLVDQSRRRELQSTHQGHGRFLQQNRSASWPTCKRRTHPGREHRRPRRSEHRFPGISKRHERKPAWHKRRLYARAALLLELRPGLGWKHPRSYAPSAQQN